MTLLLDGGGTRGAITLNILRSLETEIAKYEELWDSHGCECCTTHSTSPCDSKRVLLSEYFDRMYGVSVGGIITTMIGKLKMSVAECQKEFKKVCDRVFRKRWLSRIVPLATKYSSTDLKDVSKETIRKYCPEHRHCTGDDTFSTTGTLSTADSQEQCHMYIIFVGSSLMFLADHTC